MNKAELDAALLSNVTKSLAGLYDRVGGQPDLAYSVAVPWKGEELGVPAGYDHPPRLPQAAWTVAMESLISIQAEQQSYDIAATMHARCQSPVEELLFLAFLVYGSRMRMSPTFPHYPRSPNAECCTQPYLHLPGHVQICPQHEVGKLHIDFLVKCWEPTAEYDANGKVVGTVWPTGEILVEVDGHDFHDRTKEQASRDRKRDRELQKLGFKVYRYTGSDVWKDPFGCAQEVMDAAFRIAIGA